MEKMSGWGFEMILTPFWYKQSDRRIKNQQRGQLPVGPAVATNWPQDSLMEASTSGGERFNL